MAAFLESRIIEVDGKEYVIPIDLCIAYINGVPFAHFREGCVAFDSEIMDDYAICTELVSLECPPHLKTYIKEHFNVYKPNFFEEKGR